MDEFKKFDAFIARVNMSNLLFNCQSNIGISFNISLLITQLVILFGSFILNIIFYNSTIVHMAAIFNFVILFIIVINNQIRTKIWHRTKRELDLYFDELDKIIKERGEE